VESWFEKKCLDDKEEAEKRNKLFVEKDI